VLMGSMLFLLPLIFAAFFAMRLLSDKGLTWFSVYLYLFVLKGLSFCCLFGFFSFFGLSFVDFVFGVLFSFLLLAVGVLCFWRAVFLFGKP
jgi:hypothetical protein